MQRSRQQQARDARAASSAQGRRARRGSPMDEALLAAQHLAGNAAVGAALGAAGRQRAGSDDRDDAATERALPELAATPRVALRLPVDIAGLLTVDDGAAGGRAKRPRALRLDWTGGSGDRSIGPARVATGARTTRLSGSLHGFRPLDWAVPVSGAAGMLTPDVAFKLRVGRVDLARAGSEARVAVVDDVVSLTIDFAGGQVRLRGALTEQGEAPAEWDAEVELDHRRCARLLAPRHGRRTGGAAAATAADEPPADVPSKGHPKGTGGDAVDH